jgi:CHAT domain-containing protein/tetratricopeptide (TPR) repeat protein
MKSFRTPLKNAQGGLRAYERSPTAEGLERLQQSIRIYETLLANWPLNRSRELWAQTKNELSCAYMVLPTGDRTTHLRRAIAGLDEALAVFTKKDFPGKWATTHLRLGTACSELQDHDKAYLREAINHFKAALSVHNEQAFPKDWATIQNNMGTALYAIPLRDGDETIKQAIVCYKAALRVRTKRRFRVDWATTQNNLGVAYQSLRTGDRTQHLNLAIRCYQASLQVRTKETLPHAWAAVMNNLASAYADLPSGNPAEYAARAIACYEAALEVHTEQTFPYNFATDKNNLATVYVSMSTGDRTDNLAKAIDCYEAALRVFTDGSFPLDYAMSQTNMGDAYSQLTPGDGDQNLYRAIRCYNEALRFRSGEKFSFARAKTQTSLANAYRDLRTGSPEENLSNALRHYNAALEVLTEASYPMDWATTKAELGKTYTYLPTKDLGEDLRQALACYNAVLQVRTESAFPYIWASIQDELGVIHYSLPEVGSYGHVRRAMGHWNAALRVFDQNTFPERYQVVLDSLCAALYDLGDWEGTLQVAERSFDALDQRIGMVIEESDQRRLAETGWSSTSRAVVAAVRLKRYETALFISTRSKAQSLFQQIVQHDVLLRDLSPEQSFCYEDLSTRRRECARQYRDAQTRHHQEGQNQFIRTLSEELQRLNGEWKSFLSQATVGNDEPLLLNRSFAIADWADLATECNSVLVEFRVTHEETYMFLIGPSQSSLGASHIVTLPNFTVDTAVELIDSWASTYDPASNDGDWTAQLDRITVSLYKDLLGPLHARLRDCYPTVQRLVILPNLRLGLLPLHAAQFVDAQGNRHYLSDDYEICYAPSVQVLKQCVERERHNPRAAQSLMAVVDYRLPNSQLEFESLKRYFAPSACSLFSAGVDSKSEIMASIRQGTYKLFATHGVFNTTKAENSGLNLGRETNEFLTIHELMCLDFSGTWLAVLSACETGQTALDDLNDNQPGLPAAFLLGGAQTVVASLWMVEDRSTALLTMQLNRNIYERKMSKAAALRAAQRWLRELSRKDVRDLLKGHTEPPLGTGTSQPATMTTLRGLSLGTDSAWEMDRPFANPFYWAAFFAFGAPGVAG